jgi:hypothetical protein
MLQPFVQKTYAVFSAGHVVQQTALAGPAELVLGQKKTAFDLNSEFREPDPKTRFFLRREILNEAPKPA